jgi:hypothetical protein
MLVRNLDRDAVRSKRLIRQLLDEDRAAFLRNALQVLRNEIDSPGAQHLVGLLVANGLLLPVLCDPALGRERALAFAQAAAHLDPDVDLALARALADNAGETEHHARLMEILGVISDGIRIFPSLVRLLRHPNPHIRSKAVLLIGRGNRSPKWIRQRLADTDPRIRANAAEALWDVRTAEARELLQSLVRDSNNRVAGNAILGLYRLGDPAMIPEIAAMARHDSALFRATAAWVMGETGDPRFTETVAGLLREPNAVVRKRAFAALGSLRAAAGQAARGPRRRLSARLLESDPGKRRVMLSVEGCPSLLPTQVLVAEDGEPVLRYRVVERPLPETISVVFLVPRSNQNPAAACLPWKRPQDLWASICYAGKAQPVADVSLRFHSTPEAVAAMLERVPPAADCLDLWSSLHAAVSPDAGGGKRHVIVFSDPAERPAPVEELRTAVAAGQAFVQVISTGSDPVLEDFCRSVNGIFRLSSDDTAADAYLTLTGRYEVSFQPLNPAARALRIRALGAETSVPIPSPSPAGP